MTLKSMTGFARAAGVHGDTNWYWEARSVNGRNLDLRLRLPSGFEGLEIRARSLCQEKLARGNCSINLGVRREAGRTEIRLNEAALAQARAVAERAQALTDRGRVSRNGSMYSEQWRERLLAGHGPSSAFHWHPNQMWTSIMSV